MTTVPIIVEINEEIITVEVPNPIGIEVGYDFSPFTQQNSNWDSVSGVTEILNKPTLGTASALDVPTIGDATSTQVVLGSDSRLGIPGSAEHNSLSGLQGGSATERYHLTSAEYSVVQNTSGINTGNQDLSPYALLSGKLSQFASTTSSELAGIISDETGSGSLVFGNSPSLSNPSIIGQRRAVVTKTADYLATSTDDVIRFTASGTLSLPPATGSGKVYNPLVDGIGVQLIIDADGIETINGELTQILTDKQSLTICDTAIAVWNIL